MNLTHHFLLSMPQLTDDVFGRSLIYLVEHNQDGAWGVVVNKPMALQLGEVFSQLDIENSNSELQQEVVLRGGPVDQQNGIVLHPPGPAFEGTQNFAGGVSLSSSRDVLEALAAGEEPDEHLVVLGHAGWAAGQLESEIADNAWLTSPAHADILFNTEMDARREAVANQIGIDMNVLVTQSGNA